jgi:predicted PP-loop superfamily ATPase
MHKFFKGALAVLIAGVLTLNFCGCALLLGAAAGGAGAVMWLSGKLSEIEDASYEKTVQATKKALESMNMPIKKETHTDKVAEITSEYVDGTTVWIIVRPQTVKTSKIEIRVGMRGDKEASIKILGRIKKYL